MTTKCTCKPMKKFVSNAEKILKYCAKFVMHEDQLKKVMALFLNEIKKGLNKLTHENADVKCHITYVTELPTGDEKGKFLALDLGATNLRVLCVTLKGNKKFELKSKTYNLGLDLKTGSGKAFFDYIVDCIKNFCKIHRLQEENIALGFTLSFPIHQTSLNSGVLIQWAKGFKISGVVDNDVITLLSEAMKRKGLENVRNVVLLNNTTGTLLSCALENKNCKIGFIIGAGINGCYLEKISNVERWDNSVPKAENVIINTECGAFGNNGCLDFISTDEDKVIDENTSNPREHIIEKMCTGMHMGELVRLVMFHMTKERALFNGQGIEILEEQGIFLSQYLSDIECELPGTHTKCRTVLKELHIDSYATDEDCESVRYICECISHRSAHLVAALMATMVNKIGDKNITIGVDGSVYRLHPLYRKVLYDKLKELINPGINVHVMLSDDGSGRGAAITASIVGK